MSLNLLLVLLLMSLLNANRICGRRFAGPPVSRSTFGKNDGVEVLITEGGSKHVHVTSYDTDSLLGVSNSHPYTAFTGTDGLVGGGKTPAFVGMDHAVDRTTVLNFTDTNCIIDRDNPGGGDHANRAPYFAFTDTSCVVDDIHPFTVSIDNDAVLDPGSKTESDGPRYLSSSFVGTDGIIEEDLNGPRHLSSVLVGTDAILDENPSGPKKSLSTIAVGTDSIIDSGSESPVSAVFPDVSDILKEEPTRLDSDVEKAAAECVEDADEIEDAISDSDVASAPDGAMSTDWESWKLKKKSPNKERWNKAVRTNLQGHERCHPEAVARGMS